MSERRKPAVTRESGAEQDVRNCMYHGFNSATDKDIDCSAYVGTWLEEGYGVPPNAPVMCSPVS